MAFPQDSCNVYKTMNFPFLSFDEMKDTLQAGKPKSQSIWQQPWLSASTRLIQVRSIFHNCSDSMGSSAPCLDSNVDDRH